MGWWRPPHGSSHRYRASWAATPHGRCVRAQSCVEHAVDPRVPPCPKFPCGEERVRADALRVGDVADTAPGRVSFGFGTVAHLCRSFWGGAERVEVTLDYAGYGTGYASCAVWDPVIRRRPCPHGCA